jgi:hypothetical protein
MKNKKRVILKAQEEQNTDWLRYLATAIAVMFLAAMGI